MTTRRPSVGLSAIPINMPIGSPSNANGTSPLYATSPPAMPAAFSPSSIGDSRNRNPFPPPTGKALTPFPLHETAVKILLLENVNAAAVGMLTAQGYEVKEIKSALGEDELIRTLKDGGFQAVGIRSKTKVTARVISEVPGVSRRLMFNLAFFLRPWPGRGW